MANVNGVFGSASLPADFAKLSFLGSYIKYRPGGGATPLMALSALMKEEGDVINTEHGYWQKSFLFGGATLSAAVADGVATTFTVSDSSALIPGKILRVMSTDERVRVLTVPTATTFTCARGVGSVAAAAIASGIVLMDVGTAYEEGSIRPAALQITPGKITNYTQIFRTAWAVTGTNQQIAKITGQDTVADSKMDAADMHMMDMEKALFYGQKANTTVNGQRMRMLGGIIETISNYAYYNPLLHASANVTTLGATTTYDQLLTAIDPVFNQVSVGNNDVANSRVIFCGNKFRNGLHAIARKTGNYQIVQDNNKFGLQFDTVVFPRGTLRIIEHPYFNINATMQAQGIVMDMNTFSVGYLNGRKTFHQGYNLKGETVTADSGQDAIGGCFTTEMTCLLKNVPANAVLYNFTAAA